MRSGSRREQTPASVLPDVPSTYPTAEPGIVYTPRNYDGTFHGPLRARQALAGSQNVPAVALASRVGVPDLLRLLRSAGFSAFDKTASHYGLGVALGNAEVTLADLVSGYAVFARGGVWQEPRAVINRLVPPETRRVLSQRAAFWVTDILSDDEARAYVFGRGGSLEFPFPVAVKTGTSQAYRDNWTIGFTREVTVGVWVGNFDRRPLVGSSGVTGAAPIFHAVMLAAQRHVHGREEADASRRAGQATCANTRSARFPGCVPARRARFGHANGFLRASRRFRVRGITRRKTASSHSGQTSTARGRPAGVFSKAIACSPRWTAPPGVPRVEMCRNLRSAGWRSQRLRMARHT